MKNKELINELWKLWEAMAEAGQLTINQNFSKRYDELKAQVEIYNVDIRESGESFLPFNCPHCGEHFKDQLSTQGHRCVLRRND